MSIKRPTGKLAHPEFFAYSIFVAISLEALIFSVRGVPGSTHAHKIKASMFFGICIVRGQVKLSTSAIQRSPVNKNMD